MKTAAEFLRFLEMKTGATSVQLTAIHVDPLTFEKGRIETRSHDDLDDGGEADRWIAERNGKANLYYALNPLRGPMNKKAEKTDVACVAGLHVDIDSSKGDDVEAFVERASSGLNALPLEPFVVDSGGGVQAIWFISPRDRIKLDGKVATAEAAECYTRALEAAVAEHLGVPLDHTHNCDRILRLPFTENVPDKKKRAKGRKPRMARVVHYTEAQHPLSAFTPAPPKDAPRGAGPSASAGSEAPLTGWDDERLKDVPADVFEILKTGLKPDGGDPHVYVVCAMVRAGCSAFVIKAAYRLGKISDGSAKWPRGFDGEMDRLITRAADMVVDPKLAEMNERHHVVILGSKTRVLTWEEDEVYAGRLVPIYQSPEDFRAFHDRDSHRVQVKNKKGELVDADVPVGTWWWNNSRRKQYGGITYRPDVNDERVGGKLNLWRGFTVAPEAGNRHEEFLEHIKDNICGGDRECYEYQINWMARAVKEPNTPGEVACSWRGDKGTGKTFAVEQYGALFGRHFVTVYHPDHLTGKFNPHLQDCTFLNPDECIYASNPQHEQILKGLVTGKTLRIEPKGVNSFEVPNRLHITLTTNSRHSVAAGDKERRYFAQHVGDGKIQDGDYFRNIKHQLEHEGGRSNLLHFLLARDLTDFDVRKIPQTNELQLQKVESLRGVDAFIEEVCQDGKLPWTHPSASHIAVTSGEERDAGFDFYIRNKASAELRRLGPSRVKGILSEEWGCAHVRQRLNIGCGDRADRWKRGLGTDYPAGVAFQPLTDLRQRFIKKFGPVTWRAAATDWEQGGDDALPF